MLIAPPAFLLGNMDELQSYSVLLPPVAVVYIEYHHGQIIVVVIFLLVRVVLLPPPGQERDNIEPMYDNFGLTRSPTVPVVFCWCTTQFLP